MKSMMSSQQTFNKFERRIEKIFNKILEDKLNKIIEEKINKTIYEKLNKLIDDKINKLVSEKLEDMISDQIEDVMDETLYTRIEESYNNMIDCEIHDNCRGFYKYCNKCCKYICSTKLRNYRNMCGCCDTNEYLCLDCYTKVGY